MVEQLRGCSMQNDVLKYHSSRNNCFGWGYDIGPDTSSAYYLMVCRFMLFIRFPSEADNFWFVSKFLSIAS
ncbi:hypothetical protein KU73_00170 [Pectobacterium wasabiae]|uniref:Uncharacterized protein n=1 Tax=Pectobacterium wasabiae TaxID=55208 RepID=A0AAW3EGN2_9GAMM|nr:hypothetical protein A7983_21275 [Pectobacterium wasabiae CFBP 3304]EJS96699.1 Hypothetical protein Y17_0094 [Pectobacterium wasabiae CFBP 3304]KFX05520.1 hypothetical protein JV38_12550 [Pectobacterium wasabiae]KGA30373.1 hypothetical protein KU73_00170 [Pectobacterium wasabiae]